MIHSPSRSICCMVVLAAVWCAVPLAAQDGELKPEYYRGGGYSRAEITLENGLPGGHSLVLYLGWQDGGFRQTWATVPGYAVVGDRIDASRLKLETNRLWGEIDLWIPDPEGAHMWSTKLQIDTELAEDRAISGAFKGDAGVLTNTILSEGEALKLEPHQVRFYAYGEEHKSKMRAIHVAQAEPAEAELRIDTGHLLGGDVSYARYVSLVASFRDGKSTLVEVWPSRSIDTGRSLWHANVTSHELRFKDGRITGTVEADIAGGNFQRGVYVFTLNAAIENNFVSGSITAALREGGFRAGAGISGFVWSPKAAGRVPVLVLEIEEAVNARWPLRIHAFATGEGAFKSGMAIVPNFPQQFRIDSSKLRLGEDRVTGSVSVTVTPDSPHIAFPEPFSVQYHVDAPLARETLTEQKAAEARRRGQPIAPEGRARHTFGQRHEVGGKLTGVLHSGEELARKNAVRRELDWPAWNGPRGNFAALPTGYEMVTHLDHAEVIWKSEHTPTARGQTTRYGEGNLARLVDRGSAAGGGSSPVVYDGRVYLYYFQPAGGAYDEDYVNSQISIGNRVVPWMWSLRATDTVVCMDAATGQTLWRTSFPAQGNYFSHRGTGRAKGAYTAKLAAGGGRVYVYGTFNRTICLDAATGELQWSSPQGGLHVVALDDMAVFSGHDVVALDRATGKVRWRLQRAGFEAAAPLHWRHNGVSYIITGNDSGRVVCAEAATGEIKWEITDAGNNNRTMTLAGERGFLLLNVGGRQRNEDNRLAAYRITPEKAERVWQMPDGYHYSAHNGRIPVAHEDRVYFFGPHPAGYVLMVELETGKILQKINIGRPGASGHLQWFDDRLILQADATHSATPLLFFLADGKQLKRIGEGVWRPPHRQTSSYYNFLTTHAIADGRMYIRGGRGVYCFELRKDRVRAIEKKRRAQQEEDTD
jgi:outer membrane protein assembly factor BamB